MYKDFSELKNDLFKLKKIEYHYPGEEKEEFIGAIMKESYGTLVDIFLIDGSERSINMKYITKISSTRIPKNIRYEFDEYMKAYKELLREQKKLNDLIKKQKKVINSKEKDLHFELKELKLTYQYTSGYLPLRSALEKLEGWISDIYSTFDRGYYDYHYVDISGNDQINTFISVKSVKYADEDDFPGIVYREYDGYLNFSGEHDLLKSEVIRLSKGKKISYEKIESKVKKFNNDLVDVNIIPNISLGDKTTSIGFDVDFKIKSDKITEEDLTKIKASIDALF